MLDLAAAAERSTWIGVRHTGTVARRAIKGLLVRMCTKTRLRDNLQKSGDRDQHLSPFTLF
jgi:hypothetical protein